MLTVFEGQDTIARVNRCFGLHFKIGLSVSHKERRFIVIMGFDRAVDIWQLCTKVRTL